MTAVQYILLALLGWQVFWSGCQGLTVTNTVAIAALAVMVYTNAVPFTHWTSISGDVKRESGTNYVHEWMDSCGTNTFLEEVTPVITYRTNRTVLHSGRELFQMTNAPVRWTPSGAPPLPPTPGQHTKE